MLIYFSLDIKHSRILLRHRSHYHKRQEFIKILENAKLRLPNMKAVQIEKVSDEDAEFVSFLDDCTPTQLKFFRFNSLSYLPKTTKTKFYMRSLPKLINETTGEVFLNRLEFSEEELEQIVRASCNTERLIFEKCDIHCSTALDFGSALKYKTKTLSFQCWGDINYSDRKADWRFSPACFDNIIEAISNSGLRDSLQTISINRNQTLSAEKVQQAMNEKGMSHVTVEEKFLFIKIS